MNGHPLIGNFAFLADQPQKQEFSEWIALALKQFNLTPKNLSARSGRAKSTISMLMSGERKPSRVMALAIAEAVAKDADPHVADQIIHQALQAAGFSTPSLAAALVHEKLTEQGIPEAALSADQMDNLITEIEAITVFRIQRMMEETEKHRAKQQRHAEQESQMDQRFEDNRFGDDKYEGEARLVSRAGRN